MRRGGRSARLDSGRRVAASPSAVAPDPLPDPDTLTHHGLSATTPCDRSDRTLVIACGALAREIIALTAQGMDRIDLHCLPAILHNTPDKIPNAVEAALTERAQGYGDILVAYADCGTGGALATLCDRLGARMIAGPHCYAFLEGLDTHAAHDEIDAFYLTDFLARQFDAFVIKPLGLDRHPELRDSYFGHYKTLVYLAQTDDPALDARAQAAAKTLGLTYVRRFTGLATFAQAMDG